jgi:inorganic triphosphatase YgiF
VTAVIETELKLRGGPAELDALAVLDRIGPATLGAARTVDELDVYLDTASGALAAARWACRLRARDGRRWISCKGPAEHLPGAVLHRRPEVEGAAPDGEVTVPAEWPPSPARELVLRLAGDAPLVERITLRQRRTERTVAVSESRIGTLSLDRVAVELGGTGIGGFAMVELELDPGVEPAGVGRVLTALGERPGLEPDPLSKLEHALALARGAAGANR